MSLINKIRLSIGRAVVKLINDSTKIQELQLQLLSDEVRARVEHFQEYGFTSVPMEGAEAIVLFVGGDRSHGVAVKVDDRRYRKKGLQPGEVCMYTKNNDYVLIKAGGIVEVKASAELKVDAPLATFTGNVKVNGNIVCDGQVSDANGSMQEMRGVYNGHTHSGVQTGGASTAAPSATMT